MDKPLESDWKTFCKRVPQWRERYLAEQNPQIVALFADGQKSPTEQFWTAEKKINSVARILVDCLDGHSRSKMQMFLFKMYQHRMIGTKDLEEFSAELKERILRLAEAFSG
jgi:hypothetical protein